VLRTNGSEIKIIEKNPFMLSLSKPEDLEAFRTLFSDLLV
jgi:hypothetical protein